ncbi:MAG: autotransporter domain-containing protein [Pseudomonadota bacterium]
MLAIAAAAPAWAQSDLFFFAPTGSFLSSFVTNAGAVPTSTGTIGAGSSTGGFASVVRGDQAFAYVAYNGVSDSIQVVDTATRSVVQTVAVSNPQFMVFSPDGSTLYVANGSSNNVLVYSVGATTGMLTQTSTITAGTQPRALGISPDGTTLYVGNQSGNTLSVVNTATNATTATVSLASQPISLAVNSAGTFVYVGSVGGSTISVVDTSTNAVVTTIAAGGTPGGLVLDSSGRYLYVAVTNVNEVRVYDTASGNMLVGTFSSASSPAGLAISPDGSTLYVVNGGSANGQAFSIDGATGLLTSVGFFSTTSAGSHPGLCGNGSSAGGMLGAGGTFLATSNGALGCAGSSATMTGGTILAGANNLTMNTPIVLASQGGTVDTSGNDLTLGGVISGTGSLTKTGLGTLTVTGSSTYSGATLVNMGTLQAGAVNAFSSNSAYTVAAGATLALAGFDQTIGSLTGSGSVALGSATLTTGNDNTSTSFSGTIAGSGGLTKIGTGTLTLTGTNTYTGPTTLNAGGLVVNGSLASSVTVNGGTLGGNGTFGGLTAGSGAVLAPGNSIGTFTVNGNFAQSGGVYQVEVNPQGQADRIVATGTATISGGTVQVLAQSGTYARNTTYTILSASGGVNGAYAGVTSNFAFLIPSLSYDTSNVFLTLLQSQSAFAAGAQTANQYAVGGALDSANAAATGDFNTVLNALSVLNTQQGPWALNQISGQPVANFGTANVAANALFMNAVGQQMALAREGARSGPAAAGQRIALAESCEIEACDGTSPLSAWASAIGGLGSVQGNGNASTFTYDLGGAAAGIDYRMTPNLLAGIGMGYTSGTQWTDSFSGKGWSNAVSVTAYGSLTWAGFYLDALAGYAYASNQVQRQIAVPGLQPRTASGSTGANQFLGQAEVGYGLSIFPSAQATVTPFARVQVSTVNQAGFSEWGANSLSLTVAQQTTSSVRTTFGAELAGAVPLGTNRKVALALRLGWLHEYADTARPMTASFAGAPSNAFTVYGATPVRDSAVIGFSAATQVADNASVFVRYDGELAAGTDNHTLNAGFRLSF